MLASYATRLRAAFVLLFLSLAFASAAHAQATRTWVSGTGDDVNPCSRTAPCKTYAGAISKTAAAGIINSLDPGGFGGLTITKAITVDGNGHFGSVASSLTNGFLVNVADPNSVVVIRDIDIDGMGNGVDGIRILAAGTVVIENVSITGITGDGIDIAPTADVKVVLRNVRVQKAAVGLKSNPTAPAIVRLDADNFRATDVSAQGLLAQGASNLVFADSAFVDAATGVQVEGTSKVTIRDSSIAMGTTGVLANAAAASVALSGTTVSGNTTGLQATAGSLLSYGDNRVIDNTTNGGFTAEVGAQ